MATPAKILQIALIWGLCRLVCMQSPAPVFHIGNCHEATYLEAFLAKMALEAGGFGFAPHISESPFSVQIITSPACGFDDSAEGLLKMLYGEGEKQGRFNSNLSDVPPAVAVAGCGCSSGTQTLGLLAASSNIPVISGQATSPSLSDQKVYPHFMRTIPNDNAQTDCQARLIHHMGWQEVTWFFFQGDAFGAFFCITVPGLLGAADRHTVHRLRPQTLRSAEDWPAVNITRVRGELSALFPMKDLWPRILAFMSSFKLRYLVYLRELHRLGVVRDASVFMHPENFCEVGSYNLVTDELSAFKAFDNAGYFDDQFWLNPAIHLHGSVCTVPDTSSPWLEPHSEFLTWLGSVSREDLDGAGAPSDIGLPSVADWLTSSYRPLIFDAVFVVLRAIGDLLHHGTPASDIGGQILFDTMLLQQFAGLSGNISFNPLGERLGRFSVNNLQLVDNGFRMQTIFSYEETSGGDESVPSYLRNLFSTRSTPMFRNGWQSINDTLRCGIGLEPRVVEEGGQRLETCEECEAGRYKGPFHAQAGLCELCLPTSYSNLTGQSACNYCVQGSFSEWVGRTECELCPAGTAQDLVAQMRCWQCVAGTSSSKEGSSYCDPCPSGTYADAEAMTACIACPNGTDTLERSSRYDADCGCPEGSYRKGFMCIDAPAGRNCPFKSILDECYCLPDHRNGHDDQRSCVRCEAHLYCPGGHLAEFWMDMDDTVQIESGYMSLPDVPYSVYECVSEHVCEGLRSPFNTTGQGRVCREGVQILARCGTCEEGRFGSLAGTAEEGCHTCPSSDMSLNALKLTTAFASSFLAIVYLYARFNRPQPSAFISISLMISVVQSLQTFGQLQLAWPDILQQVIAVLDLFFTTQGYTSILSLRMECLSGQGYTGQILREALSPLIVFVHFFVLWPLARLVRRPLKSIFVHNIIGLVFTRLFIGILRTSLALFFRVIMPNGKVMVSSVPELEFMSDDWIRIVPIGLLSTVVYTLPMVTYITHLVITAPRKVVVDKSFMSKARFCFGSVRPDRHWWVLVQLAYAFAVNLSQVCTPTSNIHFKLYMTLFFLIMFVIISFSFKPFKFAENNRVLVMFNVLLVTLLVLATSFIDGSTLSWSEVEYWNNAYAYVMVALFLFGFVWASSHVAFFFFSLCVEEKGMHEGKRAQFGWEFRDCTVAMLLLDDKKLLKKLSELGDYDLHNLKEATRTMITVLLGEQVSKSMWEQRLIPGDEYKVWNYHDMQFMASDKIGKGVLQEKVAQSYRVRAWVLQMVLSFGEIKVTAERGGALVELAFEEVHAMVSHKEDATYVDRLVHSWGIHHDKPQSRESFHQMVRKSFPKIAIPNKDVEELFNVLDLRSTNHISKQDAVLAINALLPEGLLRTLSQDEGIAFEEAIEGKDDAEDVAKALAQLTKGQRQLHRHTALLLDGYVVEKEEAPQAPEKLVDQTLSQVDVGELTYEV